MFPVKNDLQMKIAYKFLVMLCYYQLLSILICFWVNVAQILRTNNACSFKNRGAQAQINEISQLQK